MKSSSYLPGWVQVFLVTNLRHSKVLLAVPYLWVYRDGVSGWEQRSRTRKVEAYLHFQVQAKIRSEEKNELRVKDRNRNHERSVCPGQCFTIRDHFKINMMKLKKKKCHLGPKQTPKWRLLTFWNTLSIFGALRVVLLTVKVKLDLAKRQTAKLLKDEDQVTAMVYAWNFSHSKEGSRRVVSSRPA